MKHKNLFLAIIVILLMVLLMGLTTQSNEVGRYVPVGHNIWVLDTKTGKLYRPIAGEGYVTVWDLTEGTHHEIKNGVLK